MEFRQDFALETAEGGIETIERKLTGIERVIVREHLQMNRRVFVAGEADEADFAFTLRLGERLDDTAGGEMQIGVVVVDDLVDLPEVEMIRLEPPQGLLQL